MTILEKKILNFLKKDPYEIPYDEKIKDILKS